MHEFYIPYSHTERYLIVIEALHVKNRTIMIINNYAVQMFSTKVMTSINV